MLRSPARRLSHRQGFRLTLKGATERFPPRRLPDGSTISVRAIDDQPYLFLTLADGRESFRPITLDVVEAYWEGGCNYIAEAALAEMRSDLGIQ
jgi:hypothetical protein